MAPQVRSSPAHRVCGSSAGVRQERGPSATSFPRGCTARSRTGEVALESTLVPRGMRQFVQRSLVEPHRLVELLASGEQDLVAQGSVARVVALRDIDRRRCPGEVRLPGEDPAVLAVVGAFGAVVVRRDVLAGCAALALSARERRVPARTAFGEQLAHGVVVFAGVLGPLASWSTTAWSSGPSMRPPNSSRSAANSTWTVVGPGRSVLLALVPVSPYIAGCPRRRGRSFTRRRGWRRGLPRRSRVRRWSDSDSSSFR